MGENQKLRRIAFVDIFASDDDFAAIESANLLEMEKEMAQALKTKQNGIITDVTIRIHSVIALKSTVEVKVIALDEEKEVIEDSDFIDEVNDILLNKTLTSYAFVVLQVENEHTCYIENELCLEKE